MKSKRKFETILILSFLIFILSFITFGIVKDSIIELTNEFSWTELLRVIKWISLYLILYRFFYLANIKIIVNKNLIEFKRLFTSEKYKPEELDYYFIDSEFANFNRYETLYIVKSKKIVERISSFDYSNYNDLKKVFENKLKLETKINFIQQLGVILGMKIKVK
jgi:hypothetical protein|tara:strand:+ start:64 stop:555 length:492 start_codon:yes stop_codon:yes gene_type:complete